MRLFLPFLSPLLAASLSLAVYIATLAPTVTFEDSGELITAAYRLGIPHEPGYPLYTLLGHVAAQIPLGNVAYRINLLSALCTALGIFFLTLAVLRTASHLQHKHLPAREHPDLQTQIAALVSGLLAAFAFETWEQSVIAEVYGLHTAFVGTILYLAIAWTFAESHRRKRTIALATALILGLASSHHTTTLLLIPALAIYAASSEPKIVLRADVLAKSTVLFLVGLAPWLYLPIASARDPVLDWGDPENLTRFLQVIGRHQYGVHTVATLHSLVDQMALYFRLLASQWPIAVLALLVPGSLLLWRANRKLLALLAGLWLLTGPLTAWLTNFPVATEDPWLNSENSALASVFFIPSYMVIAVIAGLGLLFMLQTLPRTAVRPLALLMLCVPVAVLAQNWRAIDQSEHIFAESYVHDLFQIATPGALILVNWDPFHFPTLYYQHVEKQRPDLGIVDQVLMRRSWYVRQLQRTHARWLDPAEPEIREFLSVVEAFELGLPYDGVLIERAYLAMINALIDRNADSGLDVFMTYRPEDGIAAPYVLEPMVVAYRLRAQPTSLTPLNLGQLRVQSFYHPAVRNDRMAIQMRKYMMTLTEERLAIIATAQWAEGGAELEQIYQRLRAAHDEH